MTYYTLIEAAKWTGMKPTALTKLEKEGSFKASGGTGERRFSDDDIRALRNMRLERDREMREQRLRRKCRELSLC